MVIDESYITLRLTPNFFFALVYLHEDSKNRNQAIKYVSKA